MDNSKEFANAEKRLKEDRNLVNRAMGAVQASYARARRHYDTIGSYPNVDAAELDRDFNMTRGTVGPMGCTGQALIRAEAEVVRFAEIEAKAASKLAEHQARELVRARALSRQFLFGHSRPSKTPHLDAAVPVFRQRLDALYDRLRRDAYDDEFMFASALDDLEASVKSFASAVGLERRAARQRAAKTDAAAAVAAALAA